MFLISDFLCNFTSTKFLNYELSRLQKSNGHKNPIFKLDESFYNKNPRPDFKDYTYNIY